MHWFKKNISLTFWFWIVLNFNQIAIQATAKVIKDLIIMVLFMIIQICQFNLRLFSRKVWFSRKNTITVLPYKFFDGIFQSYSFNISGEVMKSGDLKCVFGEGMPTYRNPFEKGKLIIQFTVDFPETLDPAIIPKLEKLLPAK